MKSDVRVPSFPFFGRFSFQVMVENDHPPEPIASDYVELGILLILFIIGGPLNLAAHTQVSILIKREMTSRLKIQVEVEEKI